MARGTDERVKQKYVRVKEKPEHLWKPGQSGNPGGRPKRVAELAARAGQYTDVVFAQFEDMLKNPLTRDETRLAICREMLDRGFGRPAQGISIYGDKDKDPVQAVALTAEQFREIVEAGRQLENDV